MKNQADITSDNIDKLLEYLPYYQDSTNEFYEVLEDNFFDPFIYSDKVIKFIETLYLCNFIQGFDWSSWQDQAARYVINKKLIDNVDIQTIVKLFTTHIRKDRFCSGHLADMIDNGHILNLLERLAILKGEMIL